MNEQEDVSAAHERGLEELSIQVNVSFNGSNDYTEIPADGEWHLTGYYDGNVVFDNVEVYNRVLSEDEIRDAFSGDIPVFGNYADRVLSKEEVENIFRLLSDHSEIKSWQIKNNILYLEIEEDEDS